MGLGNLRDAGNGARARAAADTPVLTFEPGMTLDFPRMTVETTATPHDANESVGFVVTSRVDGRARGLVLRHRHRDARAWPRRASRWTFWCSSRTTTTRCCATAPIRRFYKRGSPAESGI